MKKIVNFSFFTLLLLLAVSCHTKKTEVAIDPDDTMPGRKVMTIYPDSCPRDVYYYRVDENGNYTDELIREVHYYDGKKSDGSKKKYMEGGVRNNVRDGVWNAYHENGKLQATCTYRLGVSVGEERVYYENGKLAQLGFYDQSGNCAGEWHFYDEAGKERQKIVADSNTMVCGGCAKCIALHAKAKEDAPLQAQTENKKSKK